MNWFKKLFCKCDKASPTYSIYGYAIEFSVKRFPKLGWEQHFNHKVYKTKEIALQAIENARYEDFEYRLVPLYTCSFTK